MHRDTKHYVRHDVDPSVFCKKTKNKKSSFSYRQTNHYKLLIINKVVCNYHGHCAVHDLSFLLHTISPMHQLLKISCVLLFCPWERRPNDDGRLSPTSVCDVTRRRNPPPPPRRENLNRKPEVRLLETIENREKLRRYKKLLFRLFTILL